VAKKFQKKLLYFSCDNKPWRTSRYYFRRANWHCSYKIDGTFICETRM